MPHLSDYFWYVQAHIFLFPHYFLILCFVFDVNFDLLVFCGWLIYMSLCLTAPVYIAAEIFCLLLGYPGQSSSETPMRTRPLRTELQYPEIVPCINTGRELLSPPAAKFKALNTALMFPGSVHVKLSNVKCQVLQQVSHRPMCVSPW